MLNHSFKRLTSCLLWLQYPTRKEELPQSKSLVLILQWRWGVSREVKRCHCYERTGTLECWASPRRWCNYNSPANKERRSSGTPTVEGSTQAAQPPGHRLLICELPKIQLWHNAAAGCKAEKQTAWFNSMILVSFRLYLFLSHFMKGSHRKDIFSISILFIPTSPKLL